MKRNLHTVIDDEEDDYRPELTDIFHLMPFVRMMYERSLSKL